MATRSKKNVKEMSKVKETKTTTIHMTEKMKENLEAIKNAQKEASGIRLNNSGAVALALASYAEALGR